MPNIYRFQQNDIVNDTQKVGTSTWTNNVNNLTAAFTSSIQANFTSPTSSGAFFIDVYNEHTSSSTTAKQFSVAYAHRDGSGSLNFDGTNNSIEAGGYRATIADRRLLANFVGRGAQNLGSQTVRPYTSTAVSETIIGQSFSMRAINSTSLFGTNTKLLTTITIEGIDSGASVTVPVEISKEVIASVSAQGETGIVLR